MNHKLFLVLGLVALAPACKKDKAAEPAADKKSDKAADKKPEAAKATGPFAAWDLAGRTAAFQGAWVGSGDSISSRLAWKIEGAKITTWDGKAEDSLEFEVPSPCEWKRTKRSNGGSSGTVSHYTIENGKIITGLGDAGSRKDKTAIACISDKVFTLDAAGACLEWEQDMFDATKYKSSPGTCGFEKEGDKDVFAATIRGNKTTIELHGDAMYSDQIAKNHAEKVADWDAAKAAQAKK